MSRRKHGEGSVYSYVRSGVRRYRIQWYEREGTHDPDSPLRRRSQGGFPTAKDAAAALRQKLSSLDRGDPTSTARGGLTVGGFMDEWVEGHRVGESTKAGYLKIIRLHIKPYIGEVELAKLTSTRLAALYRQLESSGRRNHKGERTGEGLGPNTVHKVHQALSVALDSALGDGVIRNNPTRLKGAKPPTTKQIKEAKGEILVWTLGELTQFLKWADHEDREMSPAWTFIGHTGVRRGEVVGLRWSDLDLPTSASIRRTVATIKKKGQPEYDLTKKVKGGRPRKVELNTDVTSALRDHRRRLATVDMNRIRADRPVFANPSDGHQMRPNYVYRRWTRAVERYNLDHRTDPLPPITGHELRHTHASILLIAGWHPKAVQERLGHASFQITMDLYTHLMPSMQRDSMDAYQAMLDRQREEEARPGRLVETGED
ncbi:tyrosine-type recombinase/integrase [Pseudactinotalea sp. Z1748]|uniref:tyrosine-type recombinase/integrase n=1 Tax=Pseudactinotalea sp. Z1748 TaxID=3413027 RepID=UPI003C7D29D6